jgi:hypothetical protein
MAERSGTLEQVQRRVSLTSVHPVHPIGVGVQRHKVGPGHETNYAGQGCECVCCKKGDTQVLVETTGGSKYTAYDAQRMLQDLNNTQQARTSTCVTSGLPLGLHLNPRRCP